MKWGFRSFYAGATLAAKEISADPIQLPLAALTPLFILVTAGFMRRGATPEEYGRYVVLGGIMAVVWESMLIGVVLFVRDSRYQGVLEYLFVTPVSWLSYVAGYSLVRALAGACAVAIPIALIGLGFGAGTGTGSFLAVVAAILANLVPLTAVAVVLGGVLLMSRVATAFYNVLSYFFLAVSGFLFPVAALPRILQMLAPALPMVWGMRSVATASSSASLAGTSYYLEIGVLELLAVAYMLLAKVVFRLFESRLRKAGGLELT